jgi:hypothetical protein
MTILKWSFFATFQGLAGRADKGFRASKLSFVFLR